MLLKKRAGEGMGGPGGRETPLAQTKGFPFPPDNNKQKTPPYPGGVSFSGVPARQGRNVARRAISQCRIESEKT